jgi:predicted membrane protein
MPLEGHWSRVNTPIRRLTKRERNVVIIGVIASAAVILALILATVGNSRPAPAAGCVYVIVPGVMGAEPVDACGAQAKTVCAVQGAVDNPRGRAVAGACRRAGLL